MKVRELYEESLYSEDSFLAHYIYHLLAEQKVSLDDDIAKLIEAQANPQKVNELFQKNVLGIHKVRIYSLKMNAKDFIFIFASNPHQAIKFFTETFQQKPLNCHEYPLEFELIRGKEVVNFREIRRDSTSFPAIAGRFERVG
jgi:hypothetical protein